MLAVRAVPYWRLSAFYLLYFASLGALIPYWGLYLRAQGLDAAAIGTLMAVLAGTKIVAPNLWGWIADHAGVRMGIVRLGALAAAVCFAGVFAGSGYGWLLLVTAAFSFFWNAVLPQFEATTLGHLGEHSHRYAHVRLWGSVGFIVAVGALGRLLDRHGPALLPGVILGLLAGIWLASLLVPERAGAGGDGARAGAAAVLRRPAVLALLAVVFLMQASHGPYYAFYTLYLVDHGYSREAAGWLWSLGVVAEIGVFLVMHRLLARYGARAILIASLWLAAARWLLIAGLAEQPVVLVLAQTLHAASFGSYHGAAMHLIQRHFPDGWEGRGQALYSSLSFGAGGAVGSLAAGHLWGSVGPEATYALAGLVAACGALVAGRWLR
ncbi:MFS transporter [Inmirania thermothiophila]|uniref:PPP family 3-phenylpropionic acid transporter n=1 Tax=Inmirania thermothiophila TaxID=1750597 RepID=A0A3N1Y1Z3_9GAMM|nr:MFS transporter [Inmirania thermothiophila]ROR32844.1 PPP family 3-phenylpropionic acid transporter [Inmirania thermothiophila]